MLLLLQGPTPPAPPAPPPIPEIPDLPSVIVQGGGPAGPEIVMIFLLVCVAATIILLPLMRALARRIDRSGAGADPALQAELEELRARLAEVELQQHRLADVEERLDFAERLLTQRREPEQIGRGEV
jgi:hypothetical protein